MKPHFKKLIFVIIILLTGIFVCKQNRYSNVINSDGDGYYVYLPAFLLFHDYNFLNQHTSSKAYNKRIADSYFAREANGKKIDQFSCGVAVLWLPFFLAAHVTAKLFSLPDGYSAPYQMAIAFAAFVYLLLGLFYLFKLFNTYRFSKLTTFVVIATMLLGTNLFHYTFFEPGMSHVYSFAAITVFLYSVRSYYISGGGRYLWISLVVLAFMVLIRPFNILLLMLLPFMADDFAQFKSSVRDLFGKHFKKLLTGVLLFAAVISLQLIIWYVQTHHFFVDSYKNQGFYFGYSHVVAVLGGFRKGLFIYTPVLLLAIPGIFIVFRQNKFRFFVLMLFLAVLVYAVSCWWNWWYGMSFGHRAFIDYFAVFALLMAVFFEQIKNKILTAAVVMLMLSCIVLNQFQDKQYRQYILHWDLMTARKYASVFGKTSVNDDTNLWKARKDENKFISGNVSYFASGNDLENSYEHWNNGNSFINGDCGLPSGELCVETNPYFTMTPLYSRQLSDVCTDSLSSVSIIYKAYFMSRTNGAAPDIIFYAELDSSGVTLNKYQSRAGFSVESDKWKLITGRAEMPVKNPATKTLKACFVANDGCRRFYDDFFVVVYCKHVGY